MKNNKIMNYFICVFTTLLILFGCSKNEPDVWKGKDVEFAEYKSTIIKKISDLDFRYTDNIAFSNGKMYMESFINTGDDMKKTESLHIYDLHTDEFERLPFENEKMTRIFSICQDDESLLYTSFTKSNDNIYPNLEASIWQVKGNKQNEIFKYKIDVFYRAPKFYSIGDEAYFLAQDMKTIQTDYPPYVKNQDELSFNVYKNGKIRKIFSTVANLNEGFMYTGDGEFTDYDIIYNNQKGSIGFYTGYKEYNNFKIYFYDYNLKSMKITKTFIGKDIQILGYQDKYVYGRNKKGLFLFNLETKRMMQLSESDEGEYYGFTSLPNNIILYNYQTPYSLTEETYAIKLEDGYYKKMKLDIPDRNRDFPTFISDGKNVVYVINNKYYLFDFDIKN